MKRIVSFDAVTSSITDLRRSSNSPRYFVSATSIPSSSASSFFPCSRFGTLPSAIACARPSAIAVLPTPGSPRRTGFGFRRRTRICMQRFTSSERPMSGSSSPSRARCVRSVEHSDRVVFFPLPAPPPPTSSKSPFSTSPASAAASMPSSPIAARAAQSAASSASTSRSRSRTLTSSTSSCAFAAALRNARSVSFANGSSSSFAVEAKRRSSAGSAPVLPLCTCSSSRSGASARPPRASAACIASRFCVVADSSRCSVPTVGEPSARASVCASMITRIVSLSNWSKNIAGAPPRRRAILVGEEERRRRRRRRQLARPKSPERRCRGVAAHAAAVGLR